MNTSLLLLLIGILGFVLNRKNIVLMLISIEIILLSITFLILLNSIYFDDIVGQIFSVYIISIAGAESAIGLAILVAYYRLRGTVSVDYSSYTHSSNSSPTENKQKNGIYLYNLPSPAYFLSQSEGEKNHVTMTRILYKIVGILILGSILCKLGFFFLIDILINGSFNTLDINDLISFSAFITPPTTPPAGNEGNNSYEGSSRWSDVGEGEDPDSLDLVNMSPRESESGGSDSGESDSEESDSEESDSEESDSEESDSGGSDSGGSDSVESGSVESGSVESGSVKSSSVKSSSVKSGSGESTDGNLLNKITSSLAVILSIITLSILYINIDPIIIINIANILGLGLRFNLGVDVISIFSNIVENFYSSRLLLHY